MLLAFWFYIPLLLLCLPCLFVLRKVTMNDDQRFRQLFLNFKTNVIGGKNKLYWRGVSSFAPCMYQDKFRTKLYKKK